MRILYFSPGHRVHDARFLQALRAEGDEVIYAPLDACSLSGDLPEAGLLSVEAPPALATHVDSPQACVNLAPWAAEIIARHRPDLTLAGPLHTAGFLAALAGASNLVLMAWAYDALMAADSPVAAWAMRFAGRRAEAFFFDSPAVLAAAENLGYGFPPERQLQMPWGLDLETFAPAKNLQLREALGWGECTVVFSCRSWEPVYDIPTTVKAFALAYQARPDLRLILAGDGSLRAEVRSLAAELGVQAAVHFPGAVENRELPQLYHSADLYLSSSTCDGTSISLLEALATGALPIVTDIPGNRPWVDRAAGWLFPAGHAVAASEALLEAAALTAPARQEMAALNRAKVALQADWKANAPRLLSFLKAVPTLGLRPSSDRP